jgi:DNA-binding NarL/FixJ family response regulator
MTPAARHTHAVLVIDDHALVREGVVSVLRRAAPNATLHEADCLAQAQGLADTDQRPDTIVLDLSLPDSDGLATLQAVRALWPQARVAIVSAHNDLDLAMACLREGACAFVPKQGSLVQFEHALSVIAGCGLYFPRELFLTAGVSEPAASRPAVVLTPRQQEVLGHLLQGATNPMIAEALGISSDTVKLHVSAILQAHGVANRVQLVLACARTSTA